MTNDLRGNGGNRPSAWCYEGRLRDIQAIEKNDLIRWVKRNSAELIYDSRKDVNSLFGMFGNSREQKVYYKKYIIYLMPGNFLDVPKVHIKFFYDRRIGLGKIEMSMKARNMLYAVFFPPAQNREEYKGQKVVWGIQGESWRIPVEVKSK